MTKKHIFLGQKSEKVHDDYPRCNGYEIRVLKSYNFEPVYITFNRFVNDLYNVRLKYKGMINKLAKLLLNSPFGRFGRNINKPIHEIVEKRNLILYSRGVYSLKQLNENTFTVLYGSSI